MTPVHGAVTRGPDHRRPEDRLPEDRLPDDRGIATVWAATAVAVLLAVLVALLDLGGAVVARHRAEAAADLAALAAAGQAARGEATACARAAGVAAATGAHLALCRLRGWDAVVEVEVGVETSLLGPATAHGRARAGPARRRVDRLHGRTGPSPAGPATNPVPP